MGHFNLELRLEGNVRKVTGSIPLILLAQDEGIRRIFIPKDNAPEAAIFDDIEIYPVATLQEIIDHLTEKKPIERYISDQTEFFENTESLMYDFSQIKGQEQAKRVLEIAAAGFHNVHLKGSPGAGKTLLSRTMPTILPPVWIKLK